MEMRWYLLVVARYYNCITSLTPFNFWKDIVVFIKNEEKKNGKKRGYWSYLSMIIPNKILISLFSVVFIIFFQCIPSHLHHVKWSFICLLVYLRWHNIWKDERIPKFILLTSLPSKVINTNVEVIYSSGNRICCCDSSGWVRVILELQYFDQLLIFLSQRSTCMSFIFLHYVLKLILLVYIPHRQWLLILLKL